MKKRMTIVIFMAVATALVICGTAFAAEPTNSVGEFGEPVDIGTPVYIDHWGNVCTPDDGKDIIIESGPLTETLRKVDPAFNFSYDTGEKPDAVFLDQDTVLIQANTASGKLGFIFDMGKAYVHVDGEFEILECQVDADLSVCVRLSRNQTPLGATSLVGETFMSPTEIYVDFAGN